MRQGRNTLLTNLASYIHDAFPRHATKEIARRIDGISDRQARRIVEGKAPRYLLGKVIALLDEQYARQQRARDARHEIIRAYRLEEMAGRAIERLPYVADATEPDDRTSAAELDDGTTLPLLIADDDGAAS